MKKIYELNYKLENGKWYNILFSSKKRAKEELEHTYCYGKKIDENHIIRSFVVDRILF